MASLIGITVEDYNDLTHKVIEEVKNDAGKITGYQIKISSNNRRNILEKLDVDDKNIITLSLKKVQAAMAK